ncbi:MAG: ribbon-helix-helix protein, CopG family [Gammaproteobacteria bacterium]
MPTSVRLNPRTEALVRRLMAQRRQTKSELIRDALRALAESENRAEPTPYRLVEHLIGVADSGGLCLSERTGEKFRHLLSRENDKHHAR